VLRSRPIRVFKKLSYGLPDACAGQERRFDFILPKFAVAASDDDVNLCTRAARMFIGDIVEAVLRNQPSGQCRLHAIVQENDVKFTLREGAFRCRRLRRAFGAKLEARCLRRERRAVRNRVRNATISYRRFSADHRRRTLRSCTNLRSVNLSCAQDVAHQLRISWSTLTNRQIPRRVKASCNVVPTHAPTLSAMSCPTCPTLDQSTAK